MGITNCRCIKYEVLLRNSRNQNVPVGKECFAVFIGLYKKNGAVRLVRIKCLFKCLVEGPALLASSLLLSIDSVTDCMILLL